MITLKQFEESDYAAFIEWQKDATETDLFLFAGRTFTPPVTKEQLAAYKAEANRKTLPVKLFTVIEKGTGEKIGHIQVSDIDAVNQSAFLNRVYIRKESRGKGYGKALIEAMKQYVFNDLGFHRLSLYVLSNNLAAKRMYEQVGFKEEGVMRDARLFQGDYLSLHLMSILSNEVSFTTTTEVE